MYLPPKILAIALAATLAPAIASAQSLRDGNGSEQFTDIDNHWAAYCLEGAGAEGLMRGYPDGSFRPDRQMSRAEFATVIVKAFPNAPRIRAAPRFSDVAETFWGQAAIATAYEKGFLAGYPNNSFRPNQPITRVQALTIVANAVNPPGQDNPDGLNADLTTPTAERQLRAYLDDAAQIPDYAKAALAIAAQQSLIVNYPNVRQFRPNDAITRGEATAILCRHDGDVSTGQADARYYVPADYVARAQNSDGDAEDMLLKLGEEHVIRNLGNVGISDFLDPIARLGDRLFFSTENSLADASQIWSTDGTAAGTEPLRLLKNDHEAGGESHPEVIANTEQQFWLEASRFRTDSSGTSNRIWASNGTAAGTQPIDELDSELATAFASASSLTLGPQPFLEQLPVVLYSSQTGKSELWLSNSVGLEAAGATLLGKWDRLQAETLIPFGDQLLFAATRDRDSADSLWRSDGTAGGTIAIQPIKYVNGVAVASNENSDSRIYLTTSQNRSGSDTYPAALWTSDGTTAGTQRLKTVSPRSGLFSDAASPKLMTQMGDRFFGFANNSDGFELWSSQGTPETTLRVKQLSDRVNNWSPPEQFSNYNPEPIFKVHNGRLFFHLPVDRLINGNVVRFYELWVTDGSEVGTQQLASKQMKLGILAEGFTVYRDRLFFSWPGPDGRELWQTDGTPSGTSQVIDLLPGYRLGEPPSCPPPPPELDTPDYCSIPKLPKSSWPRSLAVLGDWLYFMVDDGDVFRTDGTVKNTQHLYRFEGWPYRSFPPNLVKLGDRILIMGFEDDVKLWAIPNTNE